MARNPHYEVKVLDIVRNFRGRHSGIVKALTTDFEEFYRQCDPEKGKQCLVGLPNGTWEVKPPQMIHTPDLAWPVSYCNLGMNQMSRQEWVERVAAVCDPWLLAVAFYSGGCASFTKSERETLFQEINELPTVNEIVRELGKSNDQSGSTMLKKPESFLAVNITSPHEDESGAAIEDGYNDGTSSYGQSKSSGTFVNSSDDDSGAQKNESGAATEDGNNDGSSSYGQSNSTGTYVNSSDDDSRAQKDESGAADDHNDGSSSYGQSKSSGTHVSSSDDDSGDSVCFRMC